MTEQDFDFIRKLLLDRSAVALEAGKQYLVETRLAPLVRQLKLGSITELVGLLRAAGWPVAAADLGDLAQRTGVVGLPNNQGMIKYKYSMLALEKMGYSATGLGENSGRSRPTRA